MSGVMDGARNPDGTYDGTKVMAAVTGLSRDTITELAQKARDNVARLHACVDHVFEPTGPLHPIRQRYRCKHCGGEVDSSAYRWYAQGREHEARRK
jgi:hypothetical protein